MITAEEYCNYIREAEESLKNIDLEIAYRKIELIGARAGKAGNPFLYCCSGDNRTQAISEDEQKVLDNDLKLARMIHDRQKVQNRLDFVRQRAEWPECLDDAGALCVGVMPPLV